MNEYYYYNFINECIKRPVYLANDNYRKYLNNKELLNKYFISYNYNNQMIKIDNKEFKLNEFINKSRELNNKPLKNIDLNSYKYTRRLYMNDQIGYIEYNYNISKKELLKVCNDIYYTLGGAAAYKEAV